MLKNWRTLLKSIDSLSEEALNKLLEEEKRGQCRLAFMLRIYGRMNALRTKRERAKIREFYNAKNKNT